MTATCRFDDLEDDPFDPRPGIDLAAATTAAHDLLRALGADLDHPDLRATPGRVARALRDDPRSRQELIALVGTSGGLA